MPDTAKEIRQRIEFLRRIDRGWPDVSDAGLEAGLSDRVGPHLAGCRKLEDLRRLDWIEVLLSGLNWERRAALDRLAPTHLTVPSGSRIRVDYADPAAPVLAVRLQEVFGLADTPAVNNGKMPVVMHLLSPGYKPVQVTSDLKSFWNNLYPEVKRELQRRYPKHAWPDDPWSAKAVAKGRSHR